MHSTNSFYHFEPINASFCQDFGRLLSTKTEQGIFGDSGSQMGWWFHPPRYILPHFSSPEKSMSRLGEEDAALLFYFIPLLLFKAFFCGLGCLSPSGGFIFLLKTNRKMFFLYPPQGNKTIDLIEARFGKLASYRRKWVSISNILSCRIDWPLKKLS